MSRFPNPVADKIQDGDKAILGTEVVEVILAKPLLVPDWTVVLIQDMPEMVAVQTWQLRRMAEAEWPCWPDERRVPGLPVVQ